MPDYPSTLKHQAEQALVDTRFDFVAKYHAVTDLRRLGRHTPGILDQGTVAAVDRLLRADPFGGVRQSYFLYREAATVLRDMIAGPDDGALSRTALAALQDLLRHIRGNAHRGAAEALGSLPLTIKGPRVADGNGQAPPAVAWTDLARAHGVAPDGSLQFIGRSLVAETEQEHRLLVVKLAKKNDRAADLGREIRWMEALRTRAEETGRRFHIPSPLTIHGQPVFRLGRLPLAPPDGMARHSQGLAIAFVTARDYFVYPNHHRVDGETAMEILGRNAYLMGWLASRGVIHEAPIPLFHTRTQRLRRDDQGRYQWFRAGRLDQWLDSCAYPNIGLSGLRDFEHLASFSGDSRQLYRHVGSHFLGLLLVAGSCFRCRDESRRGLDACGRPVDARDLFDRGLLTEMIRAIFRDYYAGFCGVPPPQAPPVDPDRLADRMVEEMGVDRYMTELLRRVDQAQMTEEQFRGFLRSKGYAEDALAGMRPGEKDVLITSGPHLGDFNRQISLPELIEAVAAMSAVCIAGRFMAQKKSA